MSTLAETPREISEPSVHPRTIGISWPFPAQRQLGVRYKLFIATASLTLFLGWMTHTVPVGPLIESDYCYQLMAADRWAHGHGPTALQPVAPHQPWEWSYDLGFLTQWPIGYSALIAGLRLLFGWTSLEAARWISVLCCAAALAGWYQWLRRMMPQGITGFLLAAAGAATAVPIGHLTNPSTDAILIASVPFVLLLAVGHSDLPFDNRNQKRHQASPAHVGLLAGGLCWIRYAAVFLPVAIGAFYGWRAWRRGLSPRRLFEFGFAAALPIAALLIINGAFGPPTSTQTQFNLGHTTAFNFSTSILSTTWLNFTDFGFYDHHAFVRRFLTLWPVILVVALLASRRIRSHLILREVPGILALSAVCVASLLGMLVLSTAVFGDKFQFVELDRYYLPIRPLYFALFVAPICLLPYRSVRAICCVALVLVALWIVQVDWARTYSRTMQDPRETTPYGQWTRCFSPGAAELYGWLRANAGPDWIIVSNYHEYVALETGIATLPIPPDAASLERWTQRIATTRNVTHPRVVFVLDSDNRWRSHWIPPVPAIIKTFELEPLNAVPASIAPYLFAKPSQAAQDHHVARISWNSS